ncbi:MAG TPA: NYN domain-containing protein [Actinomycetota bacterium]|nr:NYN domain-containing protein [Actinomycetota bacterium]
MGGGRRLIVDAMNVIGSRPDRWWNDPARAMREFAVVTDSYAARTGDRITVVFDKDPGFLPPMSIIDVLIARRKGRNAADYEIQQIVAALEDPENVTVITSDKRLAEKITSLGAKVQGSGKFRTELDEKRT